MSEQQIVIKKKKVHGGHAHHGGSWKVAYADFVTAMMAFFMVMWIMGLSQDVRNQIQGYFNDPLGFAKNEPKSRSIMSMKGMPTPKPGESKAPGKDAISKEKLILQSVRSKVERTLAQMKNSDELIKSVTVQMTPEGLLIQFTQTKGAVFFKSGSAVVRPEALQLIKKLAPILASAGRPLVVQGHTDARPFNSYPNGNWGLSTERALSLQEALMQGGVGQAQFSEVAGYGATRLLDPQHPFAFSNRRVTILVPRRYVAGQVVESPKDELRAKLDTVTEPQAVELGPTAPNIRKKDETWGAP